MPATLYSLVKQIIPDSSARTRGSIPPMLKIRYGTESRILNHVILAHAGIHTPYAQIPIWNGATHH
jgi:hypothetical protein